MRGFEPNAIITVDGHEPVLVWNLQLTTARPDSELARHWLTGQPLNGAYLRKMPLRTGGGLTLTMSVETEEMKSVLASVDAYVEALKSVGARSYLFGDGEGQ